MRRLRLSTSGILSDQKVWDAPKVDVASGNIQANDSEREDARFETTSLCKTYLFVIQALPPARRRLRQGRRRERNIMIEMQEVDEPLLSGEIA